MTNPKIEIKQFAEKEKAAAESWFQKNWLAYLLGFASAMLLAWIAHKL